MIIYGRFFFYIYIGVIPYSCKNQDGNYLKKNLFHFKYITLDVAKIQKKEEIENKFALYFINSIVFCIFAPKYCAYEDVKRIKEIV